MARIRTIKPSAFTSDSLSSVPVAARWTFAGLWTYVDDDGYGRADVRLLKAALYPLDDGVSLADIEAHLMALESIGGICRYEVEGRKLMHVVKFGEHQRVSRPTPSTLPACSHTSHGGLDDDSVSPRGALAEVLRQEVEVEVEVEVEGNGRAQRESSVTTQSILQAFLDHVPKRPPDRVIGQLATLTKEMLNEGISAPDVAEGLRRWSTKGLHPATLPSVVNEVMNATAHRSTTDDRVGAGLALAARYRKEDA